MWKAYILLKARADFQHFWFSKEFLMKEIEMISQNRFWKKILKNGAERRCYEKPLLTRTQIILDLYKKITAQINEGRGHLSTTWRKYFSITEVPKYSRKALA